MRQDHGIERHGVIARLGALLALAVSLLVVHWGMPAPVLVAAGAGAGADSRAASAPPTPQRELGRSAQLEAQRLKSVPQAGGDGLPPALLVATAWTPPHRGAGARVAAVAGMVAGGEKARAFDARGPPSHRV